MKPVGYIRISTTLKRQDENALEKQAQKLREACLGNGLVLRHIFEDVGSASSSDSLRRRTGLQDALRMASAQKGIIAVTEPSRLFRNLAEALKVTADFPDVRFWSVQHNGLLTPELLHDEVSAAASEAEATRLGTSKAQIARGFTGPDHEAKLRGSRNSLVQRRSSAAARIERLAAILEVHEQSRRLTYEEAAQLFNANMLRTSQGKEYTKVNVRRDLRAARQVLCDRRIEEFLNELNMAT